MSKSNKSKDNLILAKNFGLWQTMMSTSREDTLRCYDTLRRYSDSRDSELFQFGSDLYNCGYSLETFSKDIEMCIENRIKNKDDNREKGFISYDGIEHVPSYQKILNIADSPNLFLSVQTGYNIALRKALAKQLIEEKHRSK